MSARVMGQSQPFAYFQTDRYFPAHSENIATIIAVNCFYLSGYKSSRNVKGDDSRTVDTRCCLVSTKASCVTVLDRKGTLM